MLELKLWKLIAGEHVGDADAQQQVKELLIKLSNHPHPRSEAHSKRLLELSHHLVPPNSEERADVCRPSIIPQIFFGIIRCCGALIT
jgi:hypothetical protein